MTRGALVGIEGPWITAATGVLYAANLRRSTEAGSPFRFACSGPSLGVLTRIHGSLNAGEIPADVSGEDFARVDFQMDYPDSAGKRFNPFAKGKGEPELVLSVVPLAQDGQSFKPAQEGWSGLLECSLLVLHARVPGVDGPRAALPEDGALASVVEAISRGKGGARLRACVQWWLPAPPKAPAPAKEGESPKPAIVPPSEHAAREQLSAAMVAGFLPTTAAVLKGSGAAPPASFFAWLKPEKRAEGVRVARRQLFDVGGVEPEYPYDELTALIDHLGRLAA